ncbi:MAG: hypothetical protein KKA32_09960 [Actinobacteria bacterium]|nr:hypothetical protein [Actinomycetota bacterium]
MTRERYFVIKHGDQIFRKVCKMTIGRDGSYYLFPESPNRHYYYDRAVIPKGQASTDIKFRKGLEVNAAQPPKISFHPEGQMTLESPEGEVADRVVATPFAKLDGDHLATIPVEDLDSLPRMEPGTNVGKRVALLNPQGLRSLKLVLWAGACGLKRQPSCRKLKIEGERSSIVVGVSLEQSDHRRTNGDTGVVVITGWDVTCDPAGAMHLYYVFGV